MSNDFTPDLSWSSGAEIARAVASGATSALSVVDNALNTIAARNPTLNAFTTVTAERARARARAIDAARTNLICRSPACLLRSRICSTLKASPPSPAPRSIARIRRPNAMPR